VLAASLARRRAADDSQRPLPGVRETIARLHGAGLACGVLANSHQSAAEIAARLEAWGLARWMGSVISSRDLQEALPQPAAYRAGLSALGLSADEVAFVGHEPVELAGARRSGLVSIACPGAVDPAADVALAQWADLVPVLRSAMPAGQVG
jgi:phosphoglycolate phosphatase-like HAD superfamily hydrolase